MKDNEKLIGVVSPDKGIYPGWPVVSSPDINIINAHGNIAVATLWTMRSEVVKTLEKYPNVSVVGQLYSLNGINLMLRNLLANTNIRYLVLSGADLENSGKGVVQLWRDGVDGQQKVIGLPEVVINKEIPAEAIDRLRNNVELIDLREARTAAQISSVLGNLVKNLPNKEPWGQPEVYPEPKIETQERMPGSEGVEKMPLAGKMADVWLEILQHIMQFGESAPTNYGEQARDIKNLVAVVNQGDPFNPEITDFFPFSKDSLETYVNEFISSICPQGIAYTYGNRLQSYRYQGNTINQLDTIADKLQRDANDRGAIAILYDVGIDNRVVPHPNITGKESFRTPCIVSLQASITDGALQFTAYVRSHDMFGAWPGNILGLRRLQGELAQRLGVPVGPTITISNRAHIYEHSWAQVENILKENKSGIRKFTPDPRGNFKFRTEDGKIISSHGDPKTGAPLRPDIVWDGQRKEASVGLGKQLAALNTISQIEHALYIGQQLVLAEICVKLGITYTQDSDIVARIIEESQRKNV